MENSNNNQELGSKRPEPIETNHKQNETNSTHFQSPSPVKLRKYTSESQQMEINEQNSDAVYVKLRIEKQQYEELHSPVKVKPPKEKPMFYLVKHAERDCMFY